MQITDEEVKKRLCMGLTSYISGLVLYDQFISFEKLIALVRQFGLDRILEIKRFETSNLKESKGNIIVVRYKISNCEKKCEDNCGSREVECFGKCIFDCIDQYKSIVKEKICLEGTSNEY